jgi:hypothetical protein
MVVEIIVGITAIGTIAGPAIAIFRSNQKLRDEMKKQKEEAERLRLEERKFFYEKGRTTAIEEIKKIREDRGVGFRDAAAIAGQLCAHCQRKCIHCARAGKEVELHRLDEADMLDLKIGDVARLEDNDLLAEIERSNREDEDDLEELLKRV